MPIDSNAATILMDYFINQTLKLPILAIKWIIMLAAPKFAKEKPYIAMFIAMSTGFESICDERRGIIQEKIVIYLRRHRDAVYNEELIEEIYWTITENILSQKKLQRYNESFAEKASKNQQLVNYIVIQSHVSRKISFPVGDEDPGNIFWERVLKKAVGVMLIIILVSRCGNISLISYMLGRRWRTGLKG